MSAWIHRVRTPYRVFADHGFLVNPCSYPVSEIHPGLAMSRGIPDPDLQDIGHASFLQFVPVSPILLRQLLRRDQHPDGSGNARSPLNEPLFSQVDYHLMDRRGADAKMPLHFVFRRRNAMHVCVLMYKRQILSLPLGELGFLLPPTVVWAEEINHFPSVKDNDVFLGSVIAGFDQPLTLPFALLLDLADCIFREVYLVAAVAEVGREKYLLRHGRSLAEDCGIFNGCPGYFVSAPLVSWLSTTGGSGRFPVGGNEVFDIACLGCRKAAENVGHVFLRIDAAPSATHDDRVDDRTAASGVPMPNKQPAPFSDCTGSDRVLNQVVPSKYLVRVENTMVMGRAPRVLPSSIVVAMSLRLYGAIFYR